MSNALRVDDAALTDWRTHPLIASGPRARFVGVVPLIGSSGELLGSLTVLDPISEDQLLQLAANRLIRRQETLTCELLRDRARALRRPPVANVGKRGGDDPFEIESVMFVEPLILDGKNGVRQIR